MKSLSLLLLLLLLNFSYGQTKTLLYMGEKHGNISNIASNSPPTMRTGAQKQFQLYQNYSVHWTCHGAFGAIDNARDLDLWPCFQVIGNEKPVLIGAGIAGLSVTSNQRLVFSISGVYNSNKDQDVVMGMCTQTGKDEWNNNEWGYMTYMLFG
jgi:hypothetical protein